MLFPILRDAKDSRYKHAIGGIPDISYIAQPCAPQLCTETSYECTAGATCLCSQSVSGSTDKRAPKSSPRIVGYGIVNMVVATIFTVQKKTAELTQAQIAEADASYAASPSCPQL